MSSPELPSLPDPEHVNAWHRMSHKEQVFAALFSGAALAVATEVVRHEVRRQQRRTQSSRQQPAFKEGIDDYRVQCRILEPGYLLRQTNTVNGRTREKFIGSIFTLSAYVAQVAGPLRRPDILRVAQSRGISRPMADRAMGMLVKEALVTKDTQQDFTGSPALAWAAEVQQITRYPDLHAQLATFAVPEAELPPSDNL